MFDKSSIQIVVGLGLALLLYFSIGGLVLAQTSGSNFGQTATGSSTLGNVDTLSGVDVGEGAGAPQEISLPDVPELGTCQEAPLWWLPLALLLAGNGYIGYLVFMRGSTVSFMWVIGLGLLAYFLYSVIGCGCGEIGWCEGTPIFIALVTAIGGGVLWAKQTGEA